MHRAAPFLLAVILPAAVAAPVPPGAAQPEFGANGLLTRADLAKVRFDPRVVPEVKRVEPSDERKYRDPRAKKPPVAVHMPRTRFQSGDPIPAYFIVQNPTNHELFLDARLEVTSSRLVLSGRCDVRLTNRATGERLPVAEPSQVLRRGGDLVEVPGRGYYCVRADLGRTTDGKPLPPGEYETDWSYRQMGSAPVRFTVLPADPDTKLPERPAPKAVRYFRLESDPDGERGPAAEGGPFVWAWLEMESLDTDSLATALASGVDGVHVPDMHAIPDRDGLAEVFATWIADAKGERVTVTLRSAVTGRELDLAAVPHFHLAIESAENDAAERLRELRKLVELLEHADPRISTPFAVELRLPKDWRETCGVSKGDRVAVLVTSREVELSPEGDLIKKQAERESRPAKTSGTPIWRGVLRTPFAELPTN